MSHTRAETTSRRDEPLLLRLSGPYLDARTGAALIDKITGQAIPSAISISLGPCVGADAAGAKALLHLWGLLAARGARSLSLRDVPATVDATLRRFKIHHVMDIA